MPDVVTAAGVLLGALGVGATVYYARKANVANRSKRRLDWVDIQTAANDLGRKIKNDFTPTVIVTPGLTGATFANLLSSEFTGQPPVYVGIRVWKGETSYDVLGDDVFAIETKKWNVYIPKAPARYPDGEILIIDDFVMSGDFLEELRKRLIEGGVPPGRVRSASIVATRVAIRNHKAPDYHWWIADDDDFYFPWGKAR
jgi:hypoxanthine phosphoribosyltransferase